MYCGLEFRPYFWRWCLLLLWLPDSPGGVELCRWGSSEAGPVWRVFPPGWLAGGDVRRSRGRRRRGEGRRGEVGGAAEKGAQAEDAPTAPEAARAGCSRAREAGCGHHQARRERGVQVWSRVWPARSVVGSNRRCGSLASYYSTEPKVWRPETRSRSRRTRHILVVAGAKAAETFCLEPEPEPSKTGRLRLRKRINCEKYFDWILTDK